MRSGVGVVSKRVMRGLLTIGFAYSLCLGCAGTDGGESAANESLGAATPDVGSIRFGPPPDTTSPPTVDTTEDAGSSDVTEPPPPPAACSTDAECDDGLACTEDRCDLESGLCASDLSPSACRIDHVCWAVGESPVGQPCQRCQPGVSQEAWTSLPVGAACDDGEPCTIGDQCDSAGACLGDLRPDCCEAGLCCDVAQSSPYPAGTPCGDLSVATETVCVGQEIQERSGVPGCTGTSGEICSEALADLVWSPWVVLTNCPSGTTCVPNSNGGLPDCVASSGCVNAAQCESGLVCAQDSCVAGACVMEPVAAGTLCGEEVVSKEYSCSGGFVLERHEVPACDGLVTSCTGSTTGWTEWVVFLTCPAGQVCMVENVNQAGTCLDPGQPAACQPGSSCCKSDGTPSPAGTACGNVSKTGYQCSGPQAGASIQVRYGTPGCMGSLAQCSSAAQWLVWSPWQLWETCNANQTCQESGFPGEPPVCAGGCDEQLPCCTNGAIAADGTQCGSSASVKEYKCSTDAAGGAVLARTGYPGCNGASAFCSSAPNDLVWTDWQVHEQCGSFESCVPGFNVTQAGSCKLAVDCVPGSECCLPNGSEAPVGSQCGTSPIKVEYECNGTAKGGAVMTRTAYPGCDVWADCSESSTYAAWTDWEIHLQCGPGAVCKESYIATKPGTCESDCEPGTQCCTELGEYAPAKTLCGDVSDAKYGCTTDQKGGAVLVQYGYEGCTGYSTGCSFTSSYLHWTDWEVLEQCGPTAYCEKGFADWVEATCETDCDPSSPCCDGNGEFLPQGTQCKTSVWKSKYKCSTSDPGGAVLVQNGYFGCTGDSTKCSAADDDLYWSDAWELHLQCDADQTCSPAWKEDYPGKCK